MKYTLDKVLMKPEFDKAPDFKSTFDNQIITYAPLNLEIDINRILDGAMFIQNYLETDLLAEARKLFNVGLTNKSHCGGAASFVITYSKNGNKPYLVYSGVKEVSNSVYHITLQGIASIVPVDN